MGDYYHCHKEVIEADNRVFLVTASYEVNDTSELDYESGTGYSYDEELTVGECIEVDEDGNETPVKWYDVRGLEDEIIRFLTK